MTVSSGAHPASGGAPRTLRGPSLFRERRPVLPSWLIAPPGGAWLAVAVYLVASLMFFGKALLPHPGNTCLCIPNDPEIYMWGAKWFPYAVVHGLNPLSTNLITAPAGANLALSTMLPGPALVLWPVTAAFGPVVSFNLIEILGPVLAGWTTFLLCRRLVAGPPVPARGVEDAGAEAERRQYAEDRRRTFWPALVAGWLFGFSSYMLGQIEGHENLVLVFFIPALAHLFVRAYAGELSRRRAILALALCLIGQFSISTEVFATFTVTAAFTWVAAYLLGNGERRARLRSLLVVAVAAYAATVVICSVYIYYQLKPGGTPVDHARAQIFSSDLLGLVVPGKDTRAFGWRLQTISDHFTAGYIEGGDYFGIFLLALLALGLIWGWRRRDQRLLAAAGLIGLVLSFGAWLQIGGHRTIPLPWWVLERLPLLGLVLPTRQIVYVWLAVALFAGLTLARARAGVQRSLAVVLAVLSVLSLWPAVNRGLYHTPLTVPRLFTSAAIDREIPQGANVLVPPIGDVTMADLWQADTGFRFHLVGGYVLPPEAPSPYSRWRIYPTLTGAPPPARHAEAWTRTFLADNHVDYVVMADYEIPTTPWVPILHRLGWSSTSTAGAIVLRAPGARS